jgi:hypothetical protein
MVKNVSLVICGVYLGEGTNSQTQLEIYLRSRPPLHWASRTMARVPRGARNAPPVGNQFLLTTKWEHQ